jgi:hypothetical protein
MFRIFFLLLPSALVSAQVEPPHHTITGTVVNALTGEPIRHALVDLHGIVQKSALTGPDGRFQIEDVAEGQVMFSAQKPGFFDPNSLPASQWSPSIPWSTVGSAKNDFLLKLLPGARLLGRVTNSDGEPLEGASLHILNERAWQGHKQWANNSVNADEDGLFRADDLTPGRYVVFAHGPQAEVTAPAYYPNAPDIESAQAIDLRPGQEFRADFRLRSERGYRVTGQILGVPSTNGVGLSFQNADGETLQFQVSFDAANGQFVAPSVPSGTWTLLAFAGDNEGHQYQARQEISVNHADVANVQIMLHPNAVIPVTVNHSTAPSAGVEGSIVATLISVDQPIFQMNGMQQQGDPPVLSFLNVTPGKYKLDVQGYAHECLESAWYGSIDLTHDYLLLGPDAGVQPIVINLRADCATLTAKLRPADQQRAGVVLIVPTSSIAEPKVLQLQPQQPNQTFNRIPQSLPLSPGAYQVYAFTSPEGLEYSNPQVLRAYPSQSVTLAPGQNTELTVELSEPK